MKLLIVRHADAGDKEQFSGTKKPDQLRPLTSAGREVMQSAALGLKKIVPKVDIIATSPFTRAAQTAAILCAAFDLPMPAATPALEPTAAPDDFENWLAEQRAVPVIVAVGHEPHLGTLATWLMTGIGKHGIHLTKGGACLLEFESAARRGEGVLEWLHTADQLARSARTRARARRG
jgi:phosphohistidine phosphatase